MSIRCVLEARAVLSEGALWSPPEQKLYWIDQMRPEIHRFDPATGLDEKFDLELPDQLGGLARRAGGGFVLAGSDGLSLIDAAFATRRGVANPFADQPRATFNDAKVNRDGTIFAGTTDKLESEKLGQLYKVAPGRSPELIADGFICSNGPSFSPDGRIVYHTRSQDREIWAYELDDYGNVVRSEIFARIGLDEGIPDGSTVDAAGFLWSTHWDGGRITRYRPDGSVERVVETPCPSPTSCCFGGPDLTTLFFTSASITMVDGTWIYMDKAGFAADPTAGGIFALETDISGLEEPLFHG